METGLGEITKLISTTREEVKYQGVITRQHVNYEAVYAVEQLIKKAEAGEKASTERIGSLMGLVRDMAAQM